ncbi:hypothetical protein KSS87_009999, partial [Heliosperma pusillum]
GGTARQHGGNLGEGASHIPASKPVECQTFDSSTSRYIPGQDQTLGWSRTDTGRSEMSEEQPYVPKNTPVMAHSGHHHNGVPGTRETRDPERKLGEVHDRTTNLEKDPQAPRDVGETRHAENYQSKVIDPTGRGGEEIGVTPIAHQLGKMSIHDDSTRKTDSDVRTGQQEHLQARLGNDQLSPERQFDATRSSGQGLLHEQEQKPESYTEKISSVASEIAHKANQATGTVTSMLGYSTSSETPTNVSTLPSGYAESHEGQTVTPDKGVSLKEYLVEKLKPSEEDKALSKENPVEGGQEETKEGVVVKGKVTESEEVANRLGRSEDTDYDGVGPGLASPGKSVMNRIMDAAGSWFNKSGEPQDESDDRTQEGDERTQRNNVSESQPKQNVEEHGLQ